MKLVLNSDRVSEILYKRTINDLRYEYLFKNGEEVFIESPDVVTDILRSYQGTITPVSGGSSSGGEEAIVKTSGYVEKAKLSETNSASSESAAKTSETSAAKSATAAETSKTNAKLHADRAEAASVPDA